MSDDPVAIPEPSSARLPSDPDNIPVRVINSVSTVIIGSVVHLIGVTDRVSLASDGKFQPDPVIAARLRFDVEIARALRDQLNVQIELLTKPEGKAN
jgi:hypothetical protein